MHSQLRTALGFAALFVFVAAGCRERGKDSSGSTQGTGAGGANGAGGVSAGDVAVTNPAATSDTNPMSALRSMGNYLQSLKTFRVVVNATKDEPLEDGTNLQFDGTVRYLVRAPNAMRVELRSDRKQRDYIYDGSNLTVYAPRMHYYATVAAPPTIRAVLDTATRRYDLDFPVADLFLWGTDRAEVDAIKSSAYVGPAQIGDRDCDHFTFRQADVDWQLWIERGNRPLPCKLVITTTSLPTRPEYSAVINWELNPKVDAQSFAFVAPKDAHAIKLRDFDEPSANNHK